MLKLCSYNYFYHICKKLLLLLLLSNYYYFCAVKTVLALVHAGSYGHVHYVC